MNLFSEPFRHAVIDNFLSRKTVAEINQQWPAEWVVKDGKTSIKWHNRKLPPAAQHVTDFINLSMVEEATGIKGLMPDPELFGAGLHCIPSGGFLKMHVDFNRHPKGWHRRVNLLIYLNQTWKKEWGGYLQLGMDNPKLIAPHAGRCVIFETNDDSWHGHPEPLQCPPNVQRRSLALYYYTPSPPAAKAHTTIYAR